MLVAEAEKNLMGVVVGVVVMRVAEMRGSDERVVRRKDMVRGGRGGVVKLCGGGGSAQPRRMQERQADG